MDYTAFSTLYTCVHTYWYFSADISHTSTPISPPASRGIAAKFRAACRKMEEKIFLSLDGGSPPIPLSEKMLAAQFRNPFATCFA
jgi:hypothetical protein